MFNLFGLRKDSKKSSSEKEVDGGFVIIGEEWFLVTLGGFLDLNCFMHKFVLSQCWSLDGTPLFHSLRKGESCRAFQEKSRSGSSAMKSATAPGRGGFLEQCLV